LSELTKEALEKLLNKPQLDAVTAEDGPLLIFAGAGSGKTRVLTYRIAYLLEQKRTNPENVLAVTFTNKAASEMHDRIETLVGDGQAPSWMGTFHAICGRILRIDGPSIGISKSFVVYDEADRLALVRRIMKRAGIEDKKVTPALVAQIISAAKNELIDSTAYQSLAKDYISGEVAKIYPLYEEAMREANALDFDDLLLKTVELFQQHPKTLERWQDQFKQILVDEYQDTNRVQYVLIQMLAQKHKKLCVVGDDDQSIYKFRGADVRNIQSFSKDFPEAKIVKLEQNYRSTENILKSAHSIIANVPGRFDKKLWTDKKGGSKLLISQVFDEEEEALTTALECERLNNEEGIPLKDIAVLYRTNAQSRAVEDAFVQRGIPYKLIGGTRFYDRKEVKNAMSYMRLLLNPSDVIAFNRVINVPTRKIGEKSLEALEKEAKRRNVPLWEMVGKASEVKEVNATAATALGNFKKLINGLQEKMLTQPISEVMTDLFESTGLHEMVVDGTDQGIERWGNLQELQNVAALYGKEPGVNSLVTFLEDTALATDVDSLDTEQPGVTLITLHKVKGLEYPAVFILGAEEGLLPHGMALNEEGGIDEERRLCYVGMTRAMDKLYLSHAFKRNLFGASNSSHASRFLSELPSQCIENIKVRPITEQQAREKFVDVLANKPEPPEFSKKITTGQKGLSSADVFGI
jgi:DNA helicase-2/ATP-dependent DNA helicase PcrA